MALPLAAIPANLTANQRSGRTGRFRKREGVLDEGGDRTAQLCAHFPCHGICISAWTGPAAAQKPGGSITVGLELDIPGFDPLKVGVYDTAALTASSAIFETLTYLDDNGEAQPKLALSWDPSEDFKMWTFKLRPGVKFHDGTPFNAAAVKANFDRQKDPANKCRCAFYIAGVNSVRRPTN